MTPEPIVEPIVVMIAKEFAALGAIVMFAAAVLLWADILGGSI